MRRRLLRTLAAFGAAGTVAAPAALAHVSLEATSPGKGRTVSRARTVTVTFSGSFTTGRLTVTGPGGTVVGRGGPDPRRTSRLRAELASGLKAGSYKVAWRILDTDGHRQTGTFTFRIRR